MSKMSVFDQDWIDLVFEGRNKSYGAYQLRKQDSKTTMIALFSGIALMGLAVGIPFMFSKFEDKPNTAGIPEVTKPITPMKIYEVPLAPKTEKPEPKLEKPLPTEPEPAAPAPSLTPTVAFTAPVATSEPIEIQAPNMDDLQNSNPSNTTNPGNTQGSVTSNGPGVTGGTSENTEGKGTDNTLHIAVDEAPAYPGGINKFREEIGNKFRTPDVDSQSLLKVTIAFVVEKDGSLSNIKVTKDPGYGAGKEAIRVLQSMKTKWKPGKVKGQAVRTAYTVPITIRIN